MTTAPHTLIPLMSHLSTSVPEILYHYTSMEVLEKITSTQRIWASEASYLNDSRECVDAEELILEELNRRVGSNKRLRATVTSDIELARSASYRRRFVCSFTEYGDSLPQWRAYCPGGPGVAIGFASSALSEIPGRVGLDDPAHMKVDASLYLYKCLYTTKDKMSIVDSFASWYLSAIKNGDPYPAGYLEVYLRNCAPLFKNVGFREEREWRMVLSCGDDAVPDPQFRSANGITIPYIEMAVCSKNADFIKDVVVGPSPNLELAVRSVKRLMEARGLGNATVTPSEVPYRN